MNKSSIVAGFMAILSSVVLLSCSKDDIKPGNVEEGQPQNLTSCIKEEVALIRQIAAANNIEADFKSDNPTEWERKNLTIVWEETKGTTGSSIYRVKELRSGKSKDGGIKSLVLNDEKNNFQHLQRIVLNSAALKEVNLAHAPALRTLLIDGTSTGATALQKISLHDLAVLDSLELQNLLALETTSEDNGFNIYVNYNYPKLSYLHIKNTGIKNLTVDPENPLKELKLEDNKMLTTLTLATTKLENLSFEAKDYPVLESLNLRKLDKNSSNTVNIAGLTKLTYTNINNCESVKGINVDNCNNLKELTVCNCNLKGETCKLGNLPNLKVLDLNGNQIESIDLSALKSVTNLKLAHNNLASSDQFKLPKMVIDLELQGNEKLIKADFTPYKQIELINLKGTKKGAESYNKDTPNPLSEINLKGLTNLKRLIATNNSLKSIFDGTEVFEKLEALEVEFNGIDPIGMMNIAKAIEDIGVRVSANFQTYEATLNGRTIDYTTVASYLDDKRDELEVTVKDQDSKEVSTDCYDLKDGLLTFKKPGTYKLYVGGFRRVVDGMYTTLDSKVFTVK